MEMGDRRTIQRQRSGGVVLSYLTFGISTVVSLVYTPYMLRCLGQSEYGLFQLIGSLAQYLSLLSLGLSGSYVRFFTRYKSIDGEDGVKKLNSLYVITFLIISTVATVVGIILSFRLPFFFGRSMTEEELRIGKVMMFIMTLNASIALPRTIFTANIAANERFIFQRSVTLFYSILHPIICVIALFLGGKAISLVTISLCCTLAMSLVETTYCIKKLNFSVSTKKIEWVLFKEIFIFAFFIFINDIINQVNWSVDKVILGVFSGTVAVSVYGVAAQLNTYFLQISTIISSVFAPEVNKIVAENIDPEKKYDRLSLLFTKVGKVQFMIVMLVITGYIFFGKQFIILWAGKEYIKSFFVGLWLMIPVCIPLIQNTGIEIQRAMNKHQVRSIVYAIIALLNILLSIPLCKRYGEIGCAIGTAISLVIGNIIFINWYYFKYLHLDIGYFWMSIIKMTPFLVLPLSFGLYLMNFDSGNYIKLLSHIIAYSIVYCISLFALGLTKDEKKRILLFIKRSK